MRKSDTAFDYADGPGFQTLGKLVLVNSTTLRVSAPIPSDGLQTFVYHRR